MERLGESELLRSADGESLHVDGDAGRTEALRLPSVPSEHRELRQRDTHSVQQKLWR